MVILINTQSDQYDLNEVIALTDKSRACSLPETIFGLLYQKALVDQLASYTAKMQFSIRIYLVNMKL